MTDLTSTSAHRTLKVSAFEDGCALWHKRQHLLDTKSLTKEEIDCLISTASICKQLYNTGNTPLTILDNQTVANLFYENSTRTRSSFELAAKKLGANVINLEISTSSVAKGETIQDTARTLAAMGINAVVQRHASSGSAHTLAKCLQDYIHIINAGDGWNEHPTQALLDLFSMLEVKPNLKGSKIAIIGDIKHSRVARSNIWLLQKLGVNIHLCGPATLVPSQFAEMGVFIDNKLEDAIGGADFIMSLRLQLERQQQGFIPSMGEYKKLYRLDHTRIKAAKPTVRILHPGPVNKNVEITDKLIDDPTISLNSLQVTNGIAVRMAVLYLLLSKDNGKSLLSQIN